MVVVSPSLIKRCKNHFHNLLCEASIILGNNGFIWISPLVKEDHQKDVLRFQVPSAPGTSSIEKETQVCSAYLLWSLKASILKFSAKGFGSHSIIMSIPACMQLFLNTVKGIDIVISYNYFAAHKTF